MIKGKVRSTWQKDLICSLVKERKLHEEMLSLLAKDYLLLSGKNPNESNYLLDSYRKKVEYRAKIHN